MAIKKPLNVKPEKEWILYWQPSSLLAAFMNLAIIITFLLAIMWGMCLIFDKGSATTILNVFCTWLGILIGSFAAAALSRP